MGSFKQTRVFDPLELEIIDRVYEAAWAQLEAREHFRDRKKDSERQDALRKRIFVLAGTERIGFDTLCDKVLTWAISHGDLPTFQEPQPHYPSPKAQRPSQM